MTEPREQRTGPPLASREGLLQVDVIYDAARRAAKVPHELRGQAPRPGMPPRGAKPEPVDPALIRRAQGAAHALLGLNLDRVAEMEIKAEIALARLSGNARRSEPRFAGTRHKSWLGIVWLWLRALSSIDRYYWFAMADDAASVLDGLLTEHAVLRDYLVASMQAEQSAMVDGRQWVTQTEAAAILNVTPPRIRQLINGKKLPTNGKVGVECRVALDDVLQRLRALGGHGIRAESGGDLSDQEIEARFRRAQERSRGQP